MGRPKKYTDKYLRRLAVNLVKYAQKSPIPLKQDFARLNKFSAQRMSEFANNNELFSEALKRFEDIQQYKIIIAGMAGKINTTMAIFTLKNVAGWRDVSERVNSGKIDINMEGDLGFSIEEYTDYAQRISQSDN